MARTKEERENQKGDFSEPSSLAFPSSLLKVLIIAFLSIAIIIITIIIITTTTTD